MVQTELKNLLRFLLEQRFSKFKILKDNNRTLVKILKSQKQKQKLLISMRRVKLIWWLKVVKDLSETLRKEI